MLFSTNNKMVNRNSFSRYLLIIVVLIIGILYALPNQFDEDYAVQVSAQRGNTLDSNTLPRIERLLQSNNIEVKSVKLDEEQILIRTQNEIQQLQVQQLLLEKISRGHTIALNLASTTPEWLLQFNAKPMYLGLDLRGGVYFLMEVDIDSAVDNGIKRRVNEIRTIFRENKLRYTKINIENGTIFISLKKANDLNQASDILSDEFFDSELLKIGDNQLSLKFTQQTIRELQQYAIKQNIVTLRNRINELGVAEPVVQQQGANRIVVQLPGVQDTARAKDILGATATLEYRMVSNNSNASSYANRGYAPPGTKLYYSRSGNPILLKNEVIVTGENVVNAQAGIDPQNGSPMVNVTLDSIGGKKMLNNTKRNVGKSMAVVFIESRLINKTIDGEVVRKRMVSEEVINIAVIREQFANRFQTTGLDSSTEARDLSLLLRAGSLAAPMDIVEERTVGPNLGQDNIDQGFISVLVGFILVLIFMVIRYKIFGMIANVALTMNIILIIALLSLLQATLTLPGIAGILLTVGMAVDANVLIFERIREELRNGATIQNAIESGYNRAFITIADANITTLIAAVVLFSFGTGPIKGFAITLSFGIITSMFTAILLTRVIVNLLYGAKKIEKLKI